MNDYTIWFRYGTGKQVSSTVFLLTDEQVRELTEYLADPFELHRVDGSDMSYIFERKA